MKWLITGGAGFIGSALSNYLSKKEEDNISIIDDLSVDGADLSNVIYKVLHINDITKDNITPT